MFQWSYGQPISTTPWPASRPRPTCAVLNSVRPPGIIWPSAVQVRVCDGLEGLTQVWQSCDMLLLLHSGWMHTLHTTKSLLWSHGLWWSRQTSFTTLPREKKEFEISSCTQKQSFTQGTELAGSRTSCPVSLKSTHPGKENPLLDLKVVCSVWSTVRTLDYKPATIEEQTW